MGGSEAVIAAAIIGAAATGYSSHQATQAQRAATNAAERQASNARRAADQDQARAASRAANLAARARRQSLTGDVARPGVLTGPLGATGEAPVARKTLLGT